MPGKGTRKRKWLLPLAACLVGLAASFLSAALEEDRWNRFTAPFEALKEEALEQTTAAVEEPEIPVTLIATVYDIRRTDYGYRVTLGDVKNINGTSGNYWTGAHLPGGIWYPSDVDGLTVGMRIRLKGDMKLIGTATNPGQFDGRTYYRSKGIYWSLSSGYVAASIPPGRQYWLAGLRNRYLHLLYQVRVWLDGRLSTLAEDPYPDLFRTLLLGEKELLDSDLKDSFSANGVIHIFTVSGMHLSLVGLGLYRLLRKCRCPRLPAALFAAFFLLSYMFMTGAGISGLRASIMLILHLIAECRGRTYNGLRALAFAAILLLLYRPLQLFQSGFLFSMAAVLGVQVARYLVQMGHLTRLWREGGRDLHGLRKAAVAAEEQLLPGTLITTFTEPLMAVCYGSIPLHSVWLNLVLLPLVTPLWWDIFLSALLGRPLGRFLILPAVWFMKGLIWICSFCSGLMPEEGSTLLGIARTQGLVAALYRLHICDGSLLQLATGRPYDWEMTLCLVLLALGCGGMLLVARRRFEEARRLAGEEQAAGAGQAPDTEAEAYAGEKQSADPSHGRSVGNRHHLLRCRYPLLGSLLSLLGILLLPYVLLPLLYRYPARSLTTAFLDVGQGDCSILQFPNGRIGMIDCGSTSVKNVGKYRVEPYLEYLGAGGRLDYVWLSHADSDHISGARELLRLGFTFDYLILSSEADLYEIEDYRDQIGTIAYMTTGDEMDIGGVQICCIWPKAWETSLGNQGDNDDSMVLLVTYGDGDLLYTGDASSEGVEAYLLAHQDQYLPAGKTLADVDVLKVGHHGSASSTSEQFLSAMPHLQLASISCGVNSYGHPTAQVLERLAEADADGLILRRTDRDGATVVEWKP